jgi:hypothetical protein
LRKNYSIMKEHSKDDKGTEMIRMTLKTLYELLKMICYQNRANQSIFYRYIHNFIGDFFFDVGAEDLMITIFSNNYSLLCTVPD